MSENAEINNVIFMHIRVRHMIIHVKSYKTYNLSLLYEIVDIEQNYFISLKTDIIWIYISLNFLESLVNILCKTIRTFNRHNANTEMHIIT